MWKWLLDISIFQDLTLTTLPLVPTSRKVPLTLCMDGASFTVHNRTHLVDWVGCYGNGSILDTATLYKDRTGEDFDQFE